MAPSSREVGNSGAICSNHLPHCFAAAGESWGRCVVNLVTQRGPLGGCATHFINGTIFLHRPIGLMRSFAARIGPRPSGTRWRFNCNFESTCIVEASLAEYNTSAAIAGKMHGGDVWGFDGRVERVFVAESWKLRSADKLL